jgi:hypothetical protein
MEKLAVGLCNCEVPLWACPAFTGSGKPQFQPGQCVLLLQEGVCKSSILSHVSFILVDSGKTTCILVLWPFYMMVFSLPSSPLSFYVSWN